MKITVRDGQTLSDIAIQQYGSLEAVTLLAEANNIGITDTLQPGQQLEIPQKEYNKEVRRYCENHDVAPATENRHGEIKLRIHTEQFTKEFE